MPKARFSLAPAYAQKNGYTVAMEYVDEAESGRVAAALESHYAVTWVRRPGPLPGFHQKQMRPPSATPRQAMPAARRCHHWIAV